MLKKHKMLVEFRATRETEQGGISFDHIAKLLKDIGDIANKNGFEAFIKGYPKDDIEIEPEPNIIYPKPDPLR